MTGIQDKDYSIVGIDDGHNNIKVFTVDHFGSEVKIRLPSKGTPGYANLGSPEEINEQVVFVDGSAYTIDPNLRDPEDTRNEEYQLSKLNRALVYQALRVAGFKGQTVLITSGLPVNRFYSGTQGINKDLLSRKKTALKGLDKVSNKADDQNNIPQIKIKDVEVLCEANAAYYDTLLNLDGSLSALGENEGILEYGAGVIDIGGRTTDCVVVNPYGRSLDAKRSDTKDYGMLDFLDGIKSELKAHYNWNHINEYALQKAIEGDGIYGAKREDITSIIKKHKQIFISSIETVIASTIGDASDLPVVILCGGGAYLLKETLIEKYPNYSFIIPEDPEYANARGFYKICKHVLPSSDE